MQGNTSFGDVQCEVGSQRQTSDLQAPAVAQDTFSHVKGNIDGDATADVACDHFHRYREDIQLVKRLGAKAYRFSISWSRVLPTGRIQGEMVMVRSHFGL